MITSSRGSVSRQSARSNISIDAADAQSIQNNAMNLSNAGSISLIQLQSRPPPAPPRHQQARLGTSGGKRVIPKPNHFLAWDREREPLAERHSPRFFLAQRQPKENPYPLLYRGKATMSATPIIPVSPRRAVTDEVASVVAVSSGGAIARMNTSTELPPASALRRPTLRPDDEQLPAQHPKSSNNSSGALPPIDDRHHSNNTSVYLPPVNNKRQLPQPRAAKHHPQQNKPPSSSRQSRGDDDVLSDDGDELSPVQITPHPHPQTPPPLQQQQQQQQQQVIGRAVDSSDEDGENEDAFLREAKRKRKEQQALHRQLQIMNRNNCNNEDFGKSQTSTSGDDQMQFSCTEFSSLELDATAEDEEGDQLQQASAHVLSRRCYDLLRRLFILQNSERSVTRCFLDRMPSSEVMERIETILKRVGASRHMSQEDFHLVLNQALCPSCKRVAPILIANDTVRSVATASEKEALRKVGERRREIEAQRRCLGEARPPGNSGSSVVGAGSNHNNSVTAVYSNNAAGDHITQTESRVLFSLFETNGIVGIAQIAEGFDLLMRGQEFALLAYTRRICVDHPDASEKESTVTVLEVEWMLNAVVRFFKDDAALKACAGRLVASLWKEAHQGCVTRRTFRMAVSNDPLLFRAVQVLPKYGSQDKFALRPEIERKPLEPDPADAIEQMISGGGNGVLQSGGMSAGLFTLPGLNATSGNFSLDCSFRPSMIPGLSSAFAKGQQQQQQSQQQLPQQHHNNLAGSLAHGGSQIFRAMMSQGEVPRRASNLSAQGGAGSSTIGGMLGASVGPEGSARKRSVLGRGLAFESVDIHDAHFKADLCVSTDQKKQQSTQEAGTPEFYSRQGQLFVKAGGQEQPIFDLRT